MIHASRGPSIRRWRRSGGPLNGDGASIRAREKASTWRWSATMARAMIFDLVVFTLAWRVQPNLLRASASRPVLLPIR